MWVTRGKAIHSPRPSPISIHKAAFRIPAAIATRKHRRGGRRLERRRRVTSPTIAAATPTMATKNTKFQIGALPAPSIIFDAGATPLTEPAKRNALPKPTRNAAGAPTTPRRVSTATWLRIRLRGAPALMAGRPATATFIPYARTTLTTKPRIHHTIKKGTRSHQPPPNEIAMPPGVGRHIHSSSDSGAVNRLEAAMNDVEDLESCVAPTTESGGTQDVSARDVTK